MVGQALAAYGGFGIVNVFVVLELEAEDVALAGLDVI